MQPERFDILIKDETAGWTGDALFTDEAAESAVRFHKSLPVYRETELKPLSSAAEKYGVKAILVKDESERFGLKAFKGTGGSYAVFRCLCERLGMDPETAVYDDFLKEGVRERCGKITFVTATDGNHGKGVAWAAAMFGCRSHIFMPKGTVEARRKASEDAGADTVVITDLNYDGTVACAYQLACEKGWVFLQDTSWEGYETIPGWIIQGYLTIAAETCGQMNGEVPTHVFLQAGVGAMAGGMAGYFLNRYRETPPCITIAEPRAAACVFLSAKAGDGKPCSVEGDPVTIMAGLNCGTPCSIAWPVLRDGVSFYCACDDSVAEQGMYSYANPEGDDPVIVSGESGAVTYGLLLAILENEELRERWKIDGHSVILLINTEGDTDPDGYRRIVNGFSLR